MFVFITTKLKQMKRHSIDKPKPISLQTSNVYILRYFIIFNFCLSFLRFEWDHITLRIWKKGTEIKNNLIHLNWIQVNAWCHDKFHTCLLLRRYSLHGNNNNITPTTVTKYMFAHLIKLNTFHTTVSNVWKPLGMHFI